MPRLNLTLDTDTDRRLERYARQARARRATLARQLLRDALIRRDALEQRRKLAADYLADRADARALLADLENPQLELLGDEDE